MNIAIIPARGGSKRIPNKNIIEFMGKPMILHTLNAVKASGVFDKIHVSTDSPEIARCVEGAGFTIDFMRPPHLSDDHSPLLDSVKWVWESYNQRGLSYENIGLILPCSPLILSDDYRQAFKVFQEKNSSFPLISMTKFPCPTEWAFLQEDADTVSAENESALCLRSQDLKEKYYDTGNFCFFSKNQLITEKAVTFNRYLKYELPRSRSVDIDTMEDLEIAKILFNAIN